ncbi:Nsp1-like C-terminal region-domain-containing protein [Vararia minispora EC-137]|uniref:Nsp1-like C-terminal region-domain-containing protein n=1 Tax=Vararia minispora EC-137 TaxID=1314806 RepID=A0ACB8QPL1_9AGAM|nr:Nsp1-like C-terminal region-domain-containing protein [Vararia minispora EC-137]
MSAFGNPGPFGANSASGANPSQQPAGSALGGSGQPNVLGGGFLGGGSTGGGPGAQGGGLFGSGNNATASNAQLSGGLFGSTSGASTTPLFGSAASGANTNQSQPAQISSSAGQTLPPFGGPVFSANQNRSVNANGNGVAASTAQPVSFGRSLFGGAQNQTSQVGNAADVAPAPGMASGSLSGGGSSTSTTGTPSGGPLFGNQGSAVPTTSTATPAPATTAAASTAGGTAGLLFGGGALGTAKPADQGANTAKPATSSFFSQPSTSSTSSASANASAPAGSLFGAVKPAAISGSTIPSTLPGGNLFGAQPSTSSAAPSSLASGAGTTAPSSTKPGIGSTLFSGLGTKKPEEKKDGASPAPDLFGGTPVASSSTQMNATQSGSEKDVAPSLLSTAKPSFPVGSGATAPATSASAATSTAVSVPPPSVLRGKSIEEIVNRWSADLETHVRQFNKCASEIAVWDRALIENGNTIAALYSHVLSAERAQAEIDQSLDHIEQQQREIATTVEVYEKHLSEILGGQGLRNFDAGPADTERDKNYILAAELHTQLDDLSSSLTQLIDSVNAVSLGSSTNDKANASEDVLTQIAGVLSSHLESLQWIDSTSRDLEGKILEVERELHVRGGHSAVSPTGPRPRSGFGTSR